jgi:hypothetical protein
VSVINEIEKKDKKITMEMVAINGENFYKIANNDGMRPFFMSIVSDSNHWLFISSNGGLSAGRKNAEFALFPYYTDDKITEFADVTGSKSIFQIHSDNEIYLWEPFSERFNDKYNLSRNLYKSEFGNKVIFEEILHDFDLTFRYQWSSSDVFGFVKTSEIINNSNTDYTITLVDGIQNILPHGVNSDLQMSTSNLVDAYKRSEIIEESGLGIFALSAIIVDRAEPSEALKANVAWSLGLENPKHLLSSLQLSAFRNKQHLISESDIKGEKGAYFVSTDLNLLKNSSKSWKIIANVNQNQSQVVALSEAILNEDTLEKRVEQDVELGTQNLITLNATADGLQVTNDKRKDTRHFSNTLFNIMRGGIFDNNYKIEKHDFLAHIASANTILSEKHSAFLNDLPEVFEYSNLIQLVENQNDVDLIRLSTEYLPLKFSRRHGDPSRPWNKFSINTKSEIDGSKILDYQGNWRDIFQNWEALAYAFPDFIDGMIYKFLNASTFDGYNPYRVTKSGFDWETIEPDNPWSYIGYWGDHQIIYLQKFLEFIEKYQPGKLHSFFEKEYFVYAAVPYTIKSHQEILQNSKDTILFDHQWDKKINQKKEKLGADGALLSVNNNEIYHVNFIEKILATVLAKMSNFIPEGGIWMNTQRPEWNDANNALVGNGVSMVTLYYLRRFLSFFQKLVNTSTIENTTISDEMLAFFEAMTTTLQQYKPLLSSSINNIDRKKVLDSLGESATSYRNQIYQNGFSGKKATISKASLSEFVQLSLAFIEHSIQANKRKDGLYHAYNLMSVHGDAVLISYLPEMLEGQVAVLSSGYLSGTESLQILEAMRKSALYRPDQQSYILYPNKELPKFLEKNIIPSQEVENSVLLSELLRVGDQKIINQDIKGNYHFNGDFHNADDLKLALKKLGNQLEFKGLVANETPEILQIFEGVFNHKAFTGRSGTFYSYEGLGSIYWHMVSKLHLAVQEVCLIEIENNSNKEEIEALISHYEEIGIGIGIHKTPQVYGAFPTDPYSHTPLHRGAQQPGMTGQVKEDILTRNAEFGIKMEKGKLQFKPFLLHKNQFLANDKEVVYMAIDGSKSKILLEKNSLFFTYCQVPVIYKIAPKNELKIIYKNGLEHVNNSLELDENQSKNVFLRTGKIKLIQLSITESKLL